MELTARPYQTSSVDAIQLDKANLLVLPMRAGKSYVMSLAITKFQFKKVLVIVGFRKIAIQLQSYFPEDHTFIISGKPFNHTKQVHLATFQTYNNRDIDINEYDCCIVDEYHSRLSKRVTDVVFQSNMTTIMLTGTPLTNLNRIITTHVDNYIQMTSVRELLENNWLAPTRFMTNKHLTTGLKAKGGQDYNEEDIRQLVKKEDLLADIVNLIAKDNLATEHKTLVYVNFIVTAMELYDLLTPIYDNVFIVHSKISNKEQDTALANYQSAKSAVIISVRSISLGFDSPTSDRLIYGLFTVRHALALQILWRASTINPSNPSKVAKVYDMIGQLSTVDPYTDFSQYSKKKPCKEECAQFTDIAEKYFCLESCKSDPVLIPCIGELSYSNLQNPYVSDYRVVSGTPCKESFPLWEMEFRTEVPPNSIGKLVKYQKCKCGFESSYTVTTLSQPAEMIELYTSTADKPPSNSVISIVNVATRTIVSVLDKLDSKTYKVVTHNSSQELYKTALNYFGNQPFTLSSNHGMTLPNVNLVESLNDLVELVNWTDDNPNTGLPKKILKLKLAQVVQSLGLKKGFSYYFLQGVESKDIKPLMTKLDNPDITKVDLNRLNKKFNPPKEPYKPPTLPTKPMPIFDISDDEIPW